VANAPRLLAGGAVWAVLPGLGGFGLYVDAKLSLDSPAHAGEEFVSDLTAAQVEVLYPLHLFHTQEDAFRSFNGALLKTVTRELTVYVGGGWVERTHYVRYYDEQEIFGNLGFYWVEDPENYGAGLNLMGGGFLRMGRHLRLQFGGETRPVGFTVGFSLNYPAG
jgi:hypothetical protein